MYLSTSTGRKLRLRQLPVDPAPVPTGARMALRVSRSEHRGRYSELLSRAGQMHFEMQEMPKVRPAAFSDEHGRLRVVYKEIMLRLKKGTSAATRDKIFKHHGFEMRSRSRFVPDQYVVFHPEAKVTGADLVEVSNDWTEMDEVDFSTPNFVSEYTRTAVPSVLEFHPEQWHLSNRGGHAGQLAGEDVDAPLAWKATTGKNDIVVAVVDDGVDIDHPNLKSRIVRNPDPTDPRDLYGRDFFVPDSNPEHYDPRPKVFTFPYDQLSGNDIHATPCAGVIAGDGSPGHVVGIVPRCRILPVKIFHADYIASDARVADAIRYAALHADVISCSWGGPYSEDVARATEDAAAGRGGKGVAIFCAAGNGYAAPVDYPAKLDSTIAVAASTDQAQRAPYSNVGPEVSICAPSSGGVRGIFCSDVSQPNRGFNVGSEAAGGADGLYTNSFGGTSSATPLAAGIGAMALSINPDLTRDGLERLLQSCADKIGSGYDGSGHSPEFGYGRVNAAKVVAAAAPQSAAA